MVATPLSEDPTERRYRAAAEFDTPDAPSFPETITELGVTLAGVVAVMLAICTVVSLFA